MDNFIKSIEMQKSIYIKGIEYYILTKTYYSIEEDKDVVYIKCELSNKKVLVIIPDDNYIYIGDLIEHNEISIINDNKIKYNNKLFNKIGEGHQYIKYIEFGNEDEIEGKCAFEDYLYENEIISLGFLTEKNLRADVHANILKIDEISI